mmetsp:Transcript_20711/g.31574  ORF Transcript_20711/g.31574 Transcript_20711/m.31574 type:complete len:127 (+) Transcript_20711:245-625(+)
MKLLDLNVVNWNRLRIPSNEILADNRASNKTNASRHTISWIRLCGYYVNFIMRRWGIIIGECCSDLCIYSFTNYRSANNSHDGNKESGLVDTGMKKVLLIVSESTRSTVSTLMWERRQRLSQGRNE